MNDQDHQPIKKGAQSCQRSVSLEPVILMKFDLPESIEPVRHFPQERRKAIRQLSFVQITEVVPVIPAEDQGHEMMPSGIRGAIQGKHHMMTPPLGFEVNQPDI